MKYIHKQTNEPPELTAFKASANENWMPTYRDLDKNPIKTALMHEQGYICCYCESRLDADDCHIEHLVPQSHPTCDPLAYDNMLCSCQNRTNKGEPLHCGIRKGNRLLPITPLELHCEQAFIYTADGAIMPAYNKTAVMDTITILQLDIPKLRAKRQEAIAPFLDDNLSAQEFNDFIVGYLQKDENGRFSPFHTTIARIFKHG